MLVNWTGVVASALNFFERVTFVGYVSSGVRVRVYLADLRSSPLCMRVVLVKIRDLDRRQSFRFSRCFDLA